MNHTALYQRKRKGRTAFAENRLWILDLLSDALLKNDNETSKKLLLLLEKSSIWSANANATLVTKLLDFCKNSGSDSTVDFILGAFGDSRFYQSLTQPDRLWLLGQLAIEYILAYDLEKAAELLDKSQLLSSFSVSSWLYAICGLVELMRLVPLASSVERIGARKEATQVRAYFDRSALFDICNFSAVQSYLTLSKLPGRHHYEETAAKMLRKYASCVEDDPLIFRFRAERILKSGSNMRKFVSMIHDNPNAIYSAKVFDTLLSNIVFLTTAHDETDYRFKLSFLMNLVARMLRHIGSTTESQVTKSLLESILPALCNLLPLYKVNSGDHTDALWVIHRYVNDAIWEEQSDACCSIKALLHLVYCYIRPEAACRLVLPTELPELAEKLTAPLGLDCKSFFAINILPSSVAGDGKGNFMSAIEQHSFDLDNGKESARNEPSTLDRSGGKKAAAFRAAKRFLAVQDFAWHSFVTRKKQRVDDSKHDFSGVFPDYATHRDNLKAVVRMKRYVLIKRDVETFISTTL